MTKPSNQKGIGIGKGLPDVLYIRFLVSRHIDLGSSDSLVCRRLSSGEFASLPSWS